MKIKIENNKQEYKFTRATHDRTCITPLHRQREIEIVHICKGEYIGGIDKISFPAKKGDILVFGSGHAHSLEPCRDDCIADVVMFSAKFLHKFFSGSDSLKYLITSKMQRQCEVYDTLNNIFDNIAYEVCMGKKNSTIVVQAEMIKLWAILTRHFSGGKKQASEKPVFFDQIQKVFEYIDNNYMYDLQLSSVAEILNYTPGYVSKLFAEFSGVTFKKYLNAVRVKKACELMETTDLKLSDISIMCGFGSIRSFNENFLKIMQQSPSDYSKRRKKDVF